MPTSRATAATPPATGTCRWLAPAANGNRQLAINGVTYEVAELPDGWALYRLDAVQIVIRYTVRPDPQLPAVWSCDCPDATNRPGRKYNCKHSRALRAAMSQLPF